MGGGQEQRKKIQEQVPRCLRLQMAIALPFFIFQNFHLFIFSQNLNKYHTWPCH